MKLLVAALTVAFLAAGCVTVAPPASTTPTAAASAAPSIGVATPAPVTPAPVTPAPATATPVVSAAPTPTPAPTASATAPPSATPLATATPQSGDLTRDRLFLDDLSDPSSGWDELDEAVASVSYDGGFLAYRFNQTGWAYTVRDVDPQAVLRPAAVFVPDSEGIFGLLCGNAGLYYGAVMGTDGGVVFVTIDTGGVRVLSRHDELGLDVPIGDSTTMGVQCVAMDDGSVNLEVVVAGFGPVAVFSVADAGLANFSVAGIYGEALGAGFTMAVDTVAAFAVEGPTGQPSAGAQQLTTHIPDEFQIDCSESPVPPLIAEPATFVVTCVLQVEGDGAELLEFAQFASKADMDAAYQARVETFGVESEGSCQNGPNETTWSINDVQFGRVQCAPQAVGARFDWTDDRLNILATLVDLDGDYPATYQQWLNAGPNP